MPISSFICRMAFCAALVFAGREKLAAQMAAGPVNALIGDESFMVVHHMAPGEDAEEITRIQTHLVYVEAKLRAADVSHLNEDQLRNRLFVIDLLHNYWQAARFPSNSAYPGERRPCFIDDKGNICAVGYLLAETRGRDAAEYINDRYQYAYLPDMPEPMLVEWATDYGLSLEECAMIQPTYGPPPPDQISYASLKTGYGISSSVLGGVNLAGNIALLSKSTTSKRFARLSLLTGGAQLILGIANIKSDQHTALMNGGSSYTRYRAQNNLSYLNIAMGTATLVTGSLNLLMHAKRERNSPLSFYSYPNEANSISMGLNFSHRF